MADTSKKSAYYCFYPTCGHRTTTLQNILSHLAENHHLFIPGMDYEFDLICALLADPTWGVYFRNFVFYFLWVRLMRSGGDSVG